MNQKYSNSSVVIILFTAVLMLLTASSVSAQVETDDKTLSPYFLVKSDDPNVDMLPLKSTGAAVDIAGVIADVRVTQVYQNTGKKTLEAIYIFPASTRASVYAMKMTIGERTLEAKIQEREKARQDYEQAKQEGKSASLLEQQRPNVFQMNVANILPGDTITVELRYTELLIPTDQIYEFVYPTVVGPRYSNTPEATAPKSESWVKNPYLHEGEAAPYAFDITVNLAGSLPIQDIASDSHKIQVSYENASYAAIRLDASDKSGGNRDYVLKYRLAGGAIQSGLLLYRGETENFFLLMMQPPERVIADQIPHREYIFIVDVSGSMNGYPLDVSKQLLKNLIQRLRPSDKFNVLLFAGGSQLLSERSLEANSANIGEAIRFIENQRGGGGTELLPALKRAFALPGIEDVSRTFIIATDGYINVEKESFDLIRERLGDANMFPFGIGTSVNRYLIEGMARVGIGEPFVILKPEGAAEKAEKFREYIQYPVLTRVRLDVEGFDVYDVEPPSIPDVMANRPVIVFGKWRGRPGGKIRLTGLTGSEHYNATINVKDFQPLASHAGLKYLWARHRISLLSDYNMVRGQDSNVKEITDLGLKYNLLTAHTSFVAIDTIVRRTDGEVTTVKQPLPLPQGVSDYAVGNAVGMTRSMSPAPPVALYDNRFISKSSESAPQISKIDKDESREKATVDILRDKTSVKGTDDKESLITSLQKYLNDVLACYENYLPVAPNIKGEVILKLQIDSNGHVTSAEMASSDITHEPLKRCICDLAKSWMFTASGKPIEVEFTLELK